MALADALVELAPQKRLMVLNAALSLAETAIGLNGDAD
jgi:hypothetical protein